MASRAGVRAHPHALRRSLATHLVQAGVNVAAVQLLLGHARISTTALYVGLGLDDLREAVETIELGPTEGSGPGHHGVRPVA